MTEDVGTTARGSLSGKRKLAIWERERGCCMECGVKLMTGQFIYEHVRALELGGTDTDDNIRLTCKPCAKEKTKKDHKMAAKAKRVKQNHLGLKRRVRRCHMVRCPNGKRRWMAPSYRVERYEAVRPTSCCIAYYRV